MRVFRGNSLIEYVLPLVILSGVFIAVVQILPDRFITYMQDTMKGDRSGDRIKVQAYGKVPDSILDKYRFPATTTVQMTLSNGEVITLDNFPVNLSELVETNGGNGTTTLLASQLQTLAQQLMDEGVIDRRQAGFLLDLANQGHRFAAMERAIEDAANTPGFDWYEDKIIFEGQEYYSTGLAYQLTFSSYSTSYITDPGMLDSMRRTIESAEPDSDYPPPVELYRLAEKYHQAKDSGAMKEPVVEQVITRLVDQIARLGHASNEARHLFVTGEVSDIQEGWYSAVSDNNSVDICASGGGQDSGIQCL